MKELYLLSDCIEERGYELVEPRTFNKLKVYEDLFVKGTYHDYEGNTYEMIISEEENGVTIHHGMIKIN